MVTLACPFCQLVIHVSDGAPQVKCPMCGQVFFVSPQGTQPDSISPASRTVTRNSSAPLRGGPVESAEKGTGFVRG